MLFVPAARPPHKLQQVCATSEQRYRMVDLAVANNARFAVSRIEIDRAGLSYTVDTLAALASEYRDASLFFITGIDAAIELTTWREPERLLRMATFVAVSRPGVPPERLEAFTAALPAGLRDRVVYLPIPSIDISSHEVRERIRERRPVRYLVPDRVADLIAREGLYAEPRAGSAPEVERSGQA